MTEQVSQAVQDHTCVDIVKDLGTKHIFGKEWNNNNHLLTNLSCFIHSMDKTCSFGCQSYCHFGRVVYLVAQRQYRCTVQRYCACHYVFFVNRCPFLAEFIANTFVGRVLCTFVGAVCSTSQFNSVIYAYFFSLFLFSHGKFSHLSRNTCHSHLESV